MSEPRKEVLSDGVEIWLGDCRDVLLLIGRVDAVVTDPPYGIGEADGKAKTRTSGLTSKINGASRYQRDYGKDSWDDKPIDAGLMELIMSASDWQIIFGGNYYSLPASSCWLIWDKLNGDTDFADCEMAWTNLPKAVRRLRYLWNGCTRRERNIEREHPTQKPLGVMSWAISYLPDGAATILDPFMGSGTTGVACVNLGRKFVGIEREPKYYDIARRRISEALASPRLPFDEPTRPKQEGLFA